MPKRAPSYRLTADLAAQHGGPVLCVDTRSYGRTYRLHAERPGPSLNVAIDRRADVVGTDGFAAVADSDIGPTVTRVDIMGALEQRAGYYDECGGWSDGHDAVADRLIAALAAGDVLLVIDSPGGAAAGLQEAVRRVQEAKAANGRRITVYADEMIGSAAYWWAACVADEIYLPESGMVGSIGARGMHVSVAGALAGDGLAPTFFVWPGPGKVALAPELPLSDIGKERGDRDVMLAGEAFAAAVGAARPALTRDAIVALDADCLSGQAAVAAGLADGVASIEDVTAYALTQAGATTTTDSSAKVDRAGGTGSEETMNMRTESEGGGKGGDAEPEGEAPVGKVSSTCGACALVNEMDAKFCKGCGASMATVPEAGDGDEPPPDSEPAPGKPKGPPPPPAKPAAQARSYNSIAAVFGLREGASTLAIKTAAVSMRSALESVMHETGTKTVDDMIGTVRAQAGDARRLAKVEGDMRALQNRVDDKERMDILHALVKADLPGHTRGDLLVDRVDEVTGAHTVHPNPKSPVATSPLGQLRGYAKSKITNGAPVRNDPFKPDADAAKAAAGAPNLEAAKQNPVVIKAAERSFASADLLAAAYAAQFPDTNAPDHGV